MTCQLIVKKARRQLLSILEKRLQSNYHTSQLIKTERWKTLTVSPNKKFKSLRCFGSVFGPPHIEGNIVRQTQGEMTKSEVSDSPTRYCEESNKDYDNFNCSNKNGHHIPVMVEEVLSCMELSDNKLVVDMTFGAGGHAKKILTSYPNIRYIAVDRDPMAFRFAQEFAAKYKERQVIPLLSKFSELPVHLEHIGVKAGQVDCFLMDLGVSSMQFDSASRGFSLSKDGPLDMRMDGQRFPDSLTAADVVNTLEPHELTQILKKYGEEKLARPIAHAIVDARYAFGLFTSTKQLADVIKLVFDSNFRHDKLHRHSHVATKTFQALRIFVNDELNEVNNGLEVAHKYLKLNGRCIVISFHSLEDRIVKRHFHGIDMDLTSNISIHSYLRNSRISYDNEEIKDKFLSRHWQPLQRKIWEPSEEEVAKNPRSRSAKLRAAVKIAEK